jgi:arsenical pump membrane protein
VATAPLFITLWDRQAPLAVGRGVSWSVLPLVAGLFVIVEALDSAGGLQLARNLLDKLTEWPPLAATLTTAFGFAVASNLINNLQVSARSFLKVGVIVIPVALLLAGLF